MIDSLTIPPPDQSTGSCIVHAQVGAVPRPLRFDLSGNPFYQQVSTGLRQPKTRVQLLGPPRIHCGAVRLESRISSQTFLLFTMLVTRKDDTLSRDEVAFTLWPDLGESDARAALRRHLYRLQQALLSAGPSSWIAGDARTVGLRAPGETWVDVAEFERLSEVPETFEAAANLYAGEFAPYLDHEWALAVRDRLRRRFCRVLEQLIMQKSSQGDTRGALHYAEQLLLQDPWREDVLRRLMVLRFLVGDRAGALAYFRRFRERLRTEFDVEPMPETIACYQNVARGQVAAAARER